MIFFLLDLFFVSLAKAVNDFLYQISMAIFSFLNILCKYNINNLTARLFVTIIVL